MFLNQCFIRFFVRLKNGREHIYEGDRNTEDIVKYAKRLSGPAIKVLGSQPFQSILDSHEIFFGYFGDKEDAIWVRMICMLA